MTVVTALAMGGLQAVTTQLLLQRGCRKLVGGIFPYCLLNPWCWETSPTILGTHSWHLNAVCRVGQGVSRVALYTLETR